MTCINYNVYHHMSTDYNGRVSLTSPVPQRVCYEGNLIPYPPPEYLCGPSEGIRYYFANLLNGHGMVICAPRRR